MIYLGGDYGDAVVINDIAYTKNATNPTLHAIDASPGVGDTLNISAQAFDLYTGTSNSRWESWMGGHTPWTAAEMAVSQITSGSQAIAAGATETLFTAPSDGELRYWINGYRRAHKVSLNGLNLTPNDIALEDDDITYSAPMVLNNGDIVAITNTEAVNVTAYYRFLPFTY